MSEDDLPLPLLGRITVRPDQCGGRPCIRGMRIRVTDILTMMAGGMSATEILADYPSLESEDIAAALNYAAQQVGGAIARVA